jgi:hypothetical protein
LDSGLPALSYGIFHSNETAGLVNVRGRLICTLWPVALTVPVSTSPDRAVGHNRASGPPPVSKAR